MAVLSFTNIMEADDITETLVPVEEWGGEVKVRSISYRKMGKIKEAVSNQRGEEVSDDDTEVERGILVAGMVEPSITEEEAELLMEKSASAVIKVLTAIMGSSKAEEKALKEEEKSIPPATE